MDPSHARKPFQGVTNIVRFNWQFYVIALAAVGGLVVAGIFLPMELRWIVAMMIAGIVGTILLSLAVSWYVYDASGFYGLSWLPPGVESAARLVNINAGFDETSYLLKDRFPKAELQVFDFYNPEKHTEVSIERARKAYPAYPDTVRIGTDHIPVPEGSVDWAFGILAIHEIRDRAERVLFLRQIGRSLKADGRCTVIEHLRDIPNFIAFNIGYLHFHPHAEWEANFASAGFAVVAEQKLTPFLSAFTLKKIHGTAA